MLHPRIFSLLVLVVACGPIKGGEPANTSDPNFTTSSAGDETTAEPGTTTPTPTSTGDVPTGGTSTSTSTDPIDSSTSTSASTTDAPTSSSTTDLSTTTTTTDDDDTTGATSTTGDDTNQMTHYGAPCTVDGQCKGLIAANAVCLKDVLGIYELPDGYCSTPCMLSGMITVIEGAPDCFLGADCIGLDGYFEFCALPCDDDSQCPREGYECRQMPVISEPNDPKYCLMKDP